MEQKTESEPKKIRSALLPFSFPRLTSENEQEILEKFKKAVDLIGKDNSSNQAAHAKTIMDAFVNIQFTHDELPKELTSKTTYI